MEVPELKNSMPIFQNSMGRSDRNLDRELKRELVNWKISLKKISRMMHMQHKLWKNPEKGMRKKENIVRIFN